MRSYVRPLSWPGNSPDLNLIENIRGGIKKHRGQIMFTNNTDMWKALQREWYAIPKKIPVKNLIHRRIRSLLLRGGTHYTVITAGGTRIRPLLLPGGQGRLFYNLNSVQTRIKFWMHVGCFFIYQQLVSWKRAFNLFTKLCCVLKRWLSCINDIEIKREVQMERPILSKVIAVRLWTALFCPAFRTLFCARK